MAESAGVEAQGGQTEEPAVLSNCNQLQLQSATLIRLDLHLLAVATFTHAEIYVHPLQPSNRWQRLNGFIAPPAVVILFYNTRSRLFT